MNRVLFMNKAILLSAATVFVSSFGLQAETKVEKARSTLSELVQTKKDIVESKAAWETDKEILKATIASLKDELELLESQIEESEKERAESDNTRARLNETRSTLDAQLDGFTEVVAGFEQKVISILPYLPEPLLDQIAKLTDKLPRDGKSTQDAPRRALIVLGILQDIDKFQNSVKTYRLLLEIDGTPAKEYSVMFYGLGTAFFVDENVTTAGFGTPSATGWQWTTDNLLAQRVFDAIEIAEKKKLAEFVALPVTVE